MVLLDRDPIKQVEHVASASVANHYYVLEVSPPDELLVVVESPASTPRGRFFMCSMLLEALPSLLLRVGGLMEDLGQHGQALLRLD